jgi:hypothetical protein
MDFSLPFARAPVRAERLRDTMWLRRARRNQVRAQTRVIEEN